MSALSCLSQTSVQLPSATAKRWMMGISLLLADIFALILSRVSALCIENISNGQYTFAPSLPLLAVLGPFVLVFALAGLYPGVMLNPVLEFRSIVIASGIVHLISLGTTCFLADYTPYSLGIVVLSWSISVVTVVLGRTGVRRLGASCSWWGVPTVICGAGSVGTGLCEALQHNPSIGLKPIALLSEDPAIPTVGVADKEVVRGALALAPLLAERYRSCYAIIAVEGVSAAQVAFIISRYAGRFRRVLVISDLWGLASLTVSAKEVAGLLGIEVCQALAHPGAQNAKQAFDVVVCSLLGLVLTPLLLCLYVAIRITSPGPALYGQRRVGYGGTEFTVWKFRSMVLNADTVLSGHLDANPEMRAEWHRDQKLKNDPRLTRVGRMLRKTSLDELPQLWNVFRGEMSLVGPRPIVEAEIAKYGGSFDSYVRVRPGITGFWQISGRNATTYPERISYDEYYVNNWSIWLDLYILFRTIKTVVSCEGAY
jgi:Undecaprenyl-phosphate galactose phosphotransferase WbaP